MTDHIILVLHITDRLTKATEVQRIFTEYGCYIKTRIGLHDVSEDFCSPSGILLLEMFGDETKINEMEQELKKIEGVEIKRVQFSH